MIQPKEKIIYFLRGMGVGLFIAGCTVTVAFQNTKTVSVKDLSKKEIMEAAKDYGMVEELDAKLEELKNQVQVTVAPTKEVTTPVPSSTPTVTKSPEPEKQTEVPQSSTSSSEFVQFEIVVGDNGKTVSQKLKDAGIVKSASKFNAYLQKYEYAKKIKIGTFKLNKKYSYYEIAKIITGK